MWHTNVPAGKDQRTFKQGRIEIGKKYGTAYANKRKELFDLKEKTLIHLITDLFFC